MAHSLKRALNTSFFHCMLFFWFESFTLLHCIQTDTLIWIRCWLRIKTSNGRSRHTYRFSNFYKIDPFFRRCCCVFIRLALFPGLLTQVVHLFSSLFTRNPLQSTRYVNRTGCWSSYSSSISNSIMGSIARCRYRLYTPCARITMYTEIIIQRMFCELLLPFFLCTQAVHK